VAEERVKPRSMYVEEAIQAALDSRWSDALEINESLVERHGPDEDTHNRLGKALTELGRLDDALEAYSASLQINPLNLIAQKNVRKLSQLKGQKDASLRGSTQAIDVELFTEEPGKSALTVLRPPHKAVTVAVAPGDVVELHPSGTQLIAETARGVALGDVEPKIARRLLPLIHSGNRYQAAVARIEDPDIEIIIREVFQSPENARKSSFPLSRSPRRDEFRPYAKDSLLGARGIDEGLGDDDGDGGFEEEQGRGAEDLEEMGMSTFSGEGGETAAEAEPDSDEETRPEDEY
jgi:tetratricopeptide (TPR) repeat protein